MKTVHALLTTILLWCMGIASFGQTIMTDKEDYEPGEAMIISGFDFMDSEDIRIRILDLDRGTTVHEQVIVASQDGSFSLSWTNPPLLNPADVLYHAAAEASGIGSGYVATAYFTDGVQTRIRTNTMGPGGGQCNATVTVFATLEYKISNPNTWGPLPGKTVSFVLGSSSGSVATLSTGVASTGLGVPQGATTLSATFDGDNAFNAVNSQISFSVTGTCATPPVISCPADIVVNNAPGQAGANVTLSGANATGTPNPTISYSPLSGFFVLGTTAVTATATNSAGSDQCSFDVTVNDVEDPVISGMPSDQTVYTGPGASTCNATASWIAPTASDNSGSANLLSSHAPGSSFPVGTTTVTYTAMDAAGNSASASFDVTVIDNTNPVISGIPSNISMGTGPGNPNPSVAVSWTPPTASDNCGNATLSSSHNPGDVFAIGTHTVTYTAEDAAGNQSSSSFDVTVYDNTPPVISGLSSSLSFDVCEVVDLGTPTVSDNYDPNPSVSNNAPSTFPIGTTTVQWTATDGSGNSSMFAQTVTIGYGAVDGFLPPMSMDGTAIKIKKGRTVPIKFRLTGCPGTSNVVANIYYQLVNDNNISLEDPLEAIGTSAADIGNLFRYSASDDQYIFNLSTSSSQWAVHKKYRIIAKLVDGQEKSGYISVVK